MHETRAVVLALRTPFLTAQLDQRIEETRGVLASTVGSGQAPRLFMIEVECALLG